MTTSDTAKKSSSMAAKLIRARVRGESLRLTARDEGVLRKAPPRFDVPVSSPLSRDLVEELPVGLDFGAEGVPVIDLVPVEVLVCERAEGAFADAVLAGALAPGANVDQLGVFADVGGEADRVESRGHCR